MSKLLVGMGEALWDILPDGKQLGGAPANFAFHASQFGYDSMVVSAVGDDPLGEQILSTLKQKGLNYAIEKVSYPTGTVQITLDKAGVPSYEIKENVAWDNIPTTPTLSKLAAETAVFCFGTLAQRNPVSKRAINYFLDNMPTNDLCLKVYDINLRQHFYDKQTIENSLTKCNILKINDEEFVLLCNMLGLPWDAIVESARKLITMYGLKFIILTCGANGSYVVTVDDVSFIATPKITVCDTVGAGDSFTASFCSALLAGKNIKEAHQFATDVATYVCTQPGAMPELPDSLKNRL